MTRVNVQWKNIQGICLDLYLYCDCGEYSHADADEFGTGYAIECPFCGTRYNLAEVEVAPATAKQMRWWTPTVATADDEG